MRAARRGADRGRSRRRFHNDAGQRRSRQLNVHPHVVAFRRCAELRHDDHGPLEPSPSTEMTRSSGNGLADVARRRVRPVERPRAVRPQRSASRAPSDRSATRRRGCQEARHVASSGASARRRRPSFEQPDGAHDNPEGPRGRRPRARRDCVARGRRAALCRSSHAAAIGPASTSLTPPVRRREGLAHRTSMFSTSFTRC